MFSLVCISVPPIPITHFSISYHIYSTYVRTVLPVPITHFSITTYAYVHIEATYRSGPPKTSNSLQHMHIYSTAGPNPLLQYMQLTKLRAAAASDPKNNPQITRTAKTYTRPGINNLPSCIGSKP